MTKQKRVERATERVEYEASERCNEQIEAKERVAAGDADDAAVTFRRR